MDRRRRRAARHSPARRRGAGGSPEASALQFSDPQCVGGSEGRDAPTELLFAFLDDVFVVSNPDRTRPLYDLLGEKLAHAGIRLHAGKTKMWKKASDRPPNIDDLRDEVWNPEDQGIGDPCGFRRVRVASNGIPLGGRDQIVGGRVMHGSPTPSVPGRFFRPMCHHFLRTVPPRQSTGYTDGHDDGMWRAVEGVQWQSEMARWLTSLPMRLGGLGIRSQDGACVFFFFAEKHLHYTCPRGQAGRTEVPFHLMPRWRSPINANASLHLQKGCSHSFCNRAPEQPRPSHSPCLLNTPLHEWCFTPCPSLGQSCQEPVRLF